MREGVTNVVRHARATRCSVTVSRDAITITDDGAGVAAVDGNGLAGLRERAEASGAVVSVGPIEPRGWRLRIAVVGGAAQ